MSRAARLGLGALLLLGAARATVADAPRTFALLVGCTEYPFLARTFDAATYDAKVRLRGPAADVAAFEDVLVTTLGVPRANVTALAGWDDAAPLRNPTRDNVLRGLVRLSRAVAAGDRVVFLFAGHGSRVPDVSGDEADGRDEVLLPADVRAWEPDGRRVPGAILDDEVGVGLRAIRDAGASVWAIFDCCHAGTMVRGGDGAMRVRRLPGDLLGVPDVVARGARDGAAGAMEGDDLRGIAATYAVGAEQRAAEMRLPRAAADASWRGLLSYALVEDLRRTKGAGDLRALDGRLAAAYDAAGFHGASPSTEGDGSLSPAGPGAPAPLPRDLPALAPPDPRLRIACVDETGASLGTRGPALADPRFPTNGGPQDADWLLVRDPRLGFGLRPAALSDGPDRTFRVGPENEAVIAALEQVARVENLIRLAAAKTTATTSGLAVTLSAVGPRGEAPVLERGTLRPGDVLRVDVRNEGARTVDAWLFLLDAAYGVTVLAPGGGVAPRLAPGAAFPRIEAFVTDTTLGVERLLAIAVPAAAAAPPVDLRWLAAPPLEAASSRARAPGARGALGELLAAYAFPSRDGVRSPASSDVGPAELRAYAWTTAWGPARVPAFPEGTATATGPAARRRADTDPGTWIAGPRVTTLASSPDGAGRDLVFSGGAVVDVVAVDPRGALPALPDTAAVTQVLATGVLRPPYRFHFLPDGARAAAYDTDLDGEADLVLTDGDGDGWAERRATRGRGGDGGPWVNEDGRFAWLRAAYVAWPDDATAERAVRALRSVAP